MRLTVGQLAKMTGLTVRTLHHYDARGLLVPSQRSEARYRLYASADVLRLYRIQALQRLGLSLAEVASALQNDASSLPTLIAQQLDEIDEQIARSTQLRDLLRGIETRLRSSHEPDVAEWLRALELLATYDGHCSTGELERLLAHNNDAEWPAFIAAVRSALDRGIDLDGDEARALAQRWVRLAMARFGGDASLAKKMKLTYLEQPEIQARVQAQSGFDPQMMRFCAAITTRAHLAFWTRHLPPREVAKLCMGDEWGREWLSVAGIAKRLAMSVTTQSDEACRQLLEKWDASMRVFAGGDRSLEPIIEAALKVDADLQQFWGIDVAVLDFIARVRERLV